VRPVQSVANKSNQVRAYLPHQPDYYQAVVGQIMIDGKTSFPRITALGFAVGKMW
jgi:hypothetical protein